MTHQFDQCMSVDATQRNLRLLQSPQCFWLTGLSGAGKSTLANALDQHLNNQGLSSYVLDGDRLRHGLNHNLGFSEADRRENIRRTAETARMMVDAGLIVIVALISPYADQRFWARQLFTPGVFSEIYVSCPIAVCQKRDVKGLYAQHASHAIQGLSGINAPYEAPQCPELTIETHQAAMTYSIQELITYADRQVIRKPIEKIDF